MLQRLAWLSFVLLVLGFSGRVSARPSLSVFHCPVSVSHCLLPDDSTKTLRDQIGKLADALNQRDLKTVRSQISPFRIYVEIADRPGAYLSNSQTLVVMESFIRSQTSISCVFDFVNDDGFSGSASGTLVAWKNGRSISYKLNFEFTKSEATSGDRPYWLLTRIGIK
jgi:hypothetical protein